MNETARPQGKSMAELRSIVAADQARFDELAELWPDLLPVEQERLLEIARSYVSTDAHPR